MAFNPGFGLPPTNNYGTGHFVGGGGGGGRIGGGGGGIAGTSHIYRCATRGCPCDSFDGPAGYCSKRCRDTAFPCASRLHFYTPSEQRQNLLHPGQSNTTNTNNIGGGGNFQQPINNNNIGGGGGGGGGNSRLTQTHCRTCLRRYAVPGRDLCAECYQDYQRTRIGGGGGMAPSNSGLGGPVGHHHHQHVTASTPQQAPQPSYIPAKTPVQPPQHNAAKFSQSYCNKCRRGNSIPGVQLCPNCSDEICGNYENIVMKVLKARNEPVKFYEKQDPFYEFTNFFPAEIEYGGKIYPFSENLFQAAKFIDTAPHIAEQIRNAATPRQAFDLAHQFHHLERSDWLDMRDRVMLEALRLKFMNPHCRRVLLLTDPAVLIENTSRDSYWGNGGDNSGKNRLGMLLMQVRHELQTGVIENYVSPGIPAAPPLPPSPTNVPNNNNNVNSGSGSGGLSYNNNNYGAPATSPPNPTAGLPPGFGAGGNPYPPGQQFYQQQPPPPQQQQPMYDSRTQFAGAAGPPPTTQFGGSAHPF